MQLAAYENRCQLTSIYLLDKFVNESLRKKQINLLVLKEYYEYGTYSLFT